MERTRLEVSPRRQTSESPRHRPMRLPGSGLVKIVIRALGSVKQQETQVPQFWRLAVSGIREWRVRWNRGRCYQTPPMLVYLKSS